MTPRPRVVPATLEFALLRGAIEEIPLGVATTRGSEILYANGALERLYGAPPSGLDGKQLTALFDVDTLRYLNGLLDKRRLYDGRVRAKSFEGRPIHAELHIERYTSEAYGVGGFLVMRDVTLELGALGRLIDALGGALLHYRVDGGKLELISPGIVDLVGMTVDECTTRPARLYERIAPEERERLAFLYRRVVTGEVLTASAQVNVRVGGTLKTIHIRATGRRDTSGNVSHVDAVAIPAGASQVPQNPRVSMSPGSRRADVSSSSLALLDVSRELLREATQQLHLATRDLRGARNLITGGAVNAPEWILRDLEDSMRRTEEAGAAALTLNRRVRKGLDHKPETLPLRDVLDHVVATLAPAFGELSPAKSGGAPSRINLIIQELADFRIDEHASELALVLTYLGLRAFRMAGSGNLTIRAFEDESRSVKIELAALGPARERDDDREVTTDITLLTRQTEFDRAQVGAQVLLSAAGASIETDEATLEHAKTVISFTAEARRETRRPTR